MTEKYTTICEKCGKTVVVEVNSMNVAGGKESEEGYCPYCGHLVAKHRTSGFVRTYKDTEKS